MRAAGGVIVTGGTGALGRELVGLLLERGYRVAVPWRRAEGWDALGQATGAPDTLVGIESDLGDAAAARASVDDAVAALGTLEGLFKPLSLFGTVECVGRRYKSWYG